MKKEYKKPIIVVENFSLTRTVASTVPDCASNINPDDVTFNTVGQCYYDMGGLKLFLDKAPCEINGDKFGEYCYNNPTAETQMFRS